MEGKGGKVAKIFWPRTAPGAAGAPCPWIRRCIPGGAVRGTRVAGSGRAGARRRWGHVSAGRRRRASPAASVMTCSTVAVRRHALVDRRWRPPPAYQARI